MPDTSRDLVLRKVREMFADVDAAAKAIKLLDEYGREPHEGEQARVQMGILKLSGGRLDDLLNNICSAKQDYRDVLAYAEYPRQMRLRLDASDSEKEAASREDAAEYERWMQS